MVAADWVLFDPQALMGDAVAHHAPTAAASMTSNGRAIRVSLRLAPPPAASYIQVSSDDYHHGGILVVASDGDLLRIHTVVAANGAQASDCPYNFFVYRAHPERPSLLRLPPLPDDWRWVVWGRHSGIVHGGAAGGGGDEEFLAVDLQTRAEERLGAAGWEMVTELLQYSSGSDRWDLRRVETPRDAGERLELRCWADDAVLSFGELMCWADYDQGILLCNVVAAADPELGFVPFPGIDIWQDFTYGRGAPDRIRTVSVDGSGILRFVDVDDGRFRQDMRPDRTVTTWTLSTPAMEWVKEHTLQLGDLWSSQEYWRSPLPRRTPEFPVVNMHEPHVLHFVLREYWESRKHWLAAVDMRKGSLRSYGVYQNAIEAPQSRFDVSNMFWNIPLIRSEVCKYVSR